MNDKTNEELSDVQEETTEAENSGAESGDSGEEISANGDSGDSSEVHEAGQDEPDSFQDDGSGRSSTDSEEMGQSREEEKVDSDELEEDIQKSLDDASASTRVALPDGVRLCQNAQGEVCLSVSQKYKGGWVALDFKQWEQLFADVVGMLGDRTKAE